eukprot:scaffold100133_cov18-Tisochrysis_lutea.AAC.1
MKENWSGLVRLDTLAQVLGSDDNPDSNAKAGFIVVLLLAPTALAEKLGEVSRYELLGADVSHRQACNYERLSTVTWNPRGWWRFIILTQLCFNE